MQFISINTKLDEKYFVSNEAFGNGIDLAFKNIKLSKLKDVQIKIVETSNEIYITLTIEIVDSRKHLADVFGEIETKLNEMSQNLINAKLSNLTIVVEGDINA